MTAWVMPGICRCYRRRGCIACPWLLTSLHCFVFDVLQADIVCFCRCTAGCKYQACCQDANFMRDSFPVASDEWIRADVGAV